MEKAQKNTEQEEKKTGAAPRMDAWLKSHTKNIDALTQATRMSAEVFQGLARLQSEHMKQMMTELGQISKDLMKPGKMKDKIKSHAPKLRQHAEKTTDHARSISKSIQENAKNVSQLMQGRINEAMQENRQHFEHIRQKTHKNDTRKHWSQWLHTSTVSKH